MRVRNTFRQLAICGVAVLALSGTATAADRKTTNTLLGAGLGAAAGAVLSDGDPIMTLGGAAAGGLLGHVLTEDRKTRDRSYRRYSNGPGHYHVNHRNGPKKHHKKHHKKHRKHDRRYR